MATFQNLPTEMKTEILKLALEHDKPIQPKPPLPYWPRARRDSAVETAMLPTNNDAHFWSPLLVCTEWRDIASQLLLPLNTILIQEIDSTYCPYNLTGFVAKLDQAKLNSIRSLEYHFPIGLMPFKSIAPLCKFRGLEQLELHFNVDCILADCGEDLIGDRIVTIVKALKRGGGCGKLERLVVYAPKMEARYVEVMDSMWQSRVEEEALDEMVGCLTLTALRELNFRLARILNGAKD